MERIGSMTMLRALFGSTLTRMRVVPQTLDEEAMNKEAVKQVSKLVRPRGEPSQRGLAIKRKRK